MAVKSMSDKDRLELNKMLREAQVQKEEIDKAIRAKVPGMEPIQDHCVDCIERIVALKAEYYGDKK
jgi:hypothetical protein